MRTRRDLQGVIEGIDAAMLYAANEASDMSQYWSSWNLAITGLPLSEEVPSDLSYWWRNQLLDASRRAFDNSVLRRRYHREDFNSDGVPTGIVWNSAPCVYRDREIRVELRRETSSASWCASVTISDLYELKIAARIFFARLPSAAGGAIGAYALVIERARREVDRLAALPFGAL